MKTINDFKFQINISVDSYKDKVEAQDCVATRELAHKHGKEKMAFKEQTVTVGEFVQYAISGHSFCNLFNVQPDKLYPVTVKGQTFYTSAFYKKGKNAGAMKLSFKSDDYYRGQQVIFVDIDLTQFKTIEDYLDTLTYKPTCTYTSFSDNKMKGGVISRRFRMVYVFDNILNDEEARKVSEILYKQIITDTNEPMDDDCGMRGSQYMNGTNGGETDITNIIYSVSDFITDTTMTCTEPVNVVYQVEEEKPVETKKTEFKIDEQLVTDMWRLPYEEFMHYNSNKYHYYYRTEREDWEYGVYQLTDENYISLYYNLNTVTDGSKRRKKLYERMCLRRVMNPNATPETILFNAYLDREKYFDNSDGVITIECLVKNVKSAFQLSIEDIKDKFSDAISYSQAHKPKFIVNSTIFEKQKTIAQVRKFLTQSEIGNLYDCNLTIEENLLYFESNGLKIKKSTLYKFVKENGLETKKNTKETELVTSLIDVNKSIRENLNMLHDMGINTTKYQVEKAMKIKK